jgi:hypothetical protein
VVSFTPQSLHPPGERTLDAPWIGSLTTTTTIIITIIIIIVMGD